MNCGRMTAYTRPFLKSEVAAMVGLNGKYLWHTIHRNAELMARLREAGYVNRRVRTLTAAQSEIVIGYYGVDAARCCIDEKFDER